MALGTALGLGAGLLVGLVVGEWLGAVNPERVRRILRQPEPDSVDPTGLERAIRRALKNTAATRRLNLSARALDGGLVELTGTAPDERTRAVAGQTAAAIAGADAVVNRILVEGRDVPPGFTAPQPG